MALLRAVIGTKPVRYRACFFSTAPKEQLEREQYSLSDIRILKELGFDVTIANRFADIPGDCDLYFSWWASGSILPMVKAKLRGRPNLVVAGGNEAVVYRDSLTRQALGYLNMPIYKKIATRLVLRFSTVVTVVSRYMVSHVQRLAGGRTPIVVPNCVDTTAFAPGDEQREYVTTIFRMDEEPTRVKRGDVFIRAIPYVMQRYPEQKFLIIGFKGDAYPRLHALAQALGVLHSVEFAGAMKNDLVIDHLRRSKVYVQASDTETFGLAVAEAMSTETPVVVSGAGALPELTQGVGIVVDQNSPESVAAGILRVLDLSEGERGQLGRACRDIVVNRFGYEARKQALAGMIASLRLPGGKPLFPTVSGHAQDGGAGTK